MPYFRAFSAFSVTATNFMNSITFVMNYLFLISSDFSDFASLSDPQTLPFFFKRVPPWFYLRRRTLYPTELRAHKNLLYFNACCPFCQRRSSANTTNARSERTGRLWEEGDNTKGDRAPACRLAGMSGGLLYRGSDGNGGQRPPSGPRPRLSALDPSAASRRLSGKPCRPGRAGTEWIRTGSQLTPRPSTAW